MSEFHQNNQITKSVIQRDDESEIKTKKLGKQEKFCANPNCISINGELGFWRTD